MLRPTPYRSTLLPAAAATACLLLTPITSSLLLAQAAEAAPLPVAHLEGECAQPSEVGCPLPLGQAMAAALTDPSHIHTWTVAIPTPKHLRLVLHGLPEDYDLHVYGPDGQLAGESVREGTSDDVVELKGAPAGTYVAYVNSPFGAVSETPYGLLASGEEVAPPPPPPPVPTQAPAPTPPPAAPTPTGRPAIAAENVSRVTQLRTLRGHSSAVQELAAFADGRFLASGASDGVVKLWDLGSFGEARTIIGQRAIEAVAASPDGKRLATGADDGRVRMYDASNGRELWSFDPLPAPVRALAFSQDGRYLAIAGDEPKVRLWDLQGGATPGDRPDRPARTWDHKAAVWSLAFSPDGKYLITGSDDGTTRVWDTSSNGTEVRGLRPASGGVNVRGAGVSGDGRYIVSGGDHAIGVWGLDTGREAQLMEPGAATNGLAIAPSGRLVAVAVDRSVKLYELESGRELRTLQGHTATALTVAFSPDGKLLMSAGKDGTVIVWGIE
jgi:WD40 repeat protein